MKYSVMFHHFHDDNKYPSLQGAGSISAIDFHSIIDYLDENVDKFQFVHEFYFSYVPTSPAIKIINPYIL